MKRGFLNSSKARAKLPADVPTKNGSTEYKNPSNEIVKNGVHGKVSNKTDLGTNPGPSPNANVLAALQGHQSTILYTECAPRRADSIPDAIVRTTAPVDHRTMDYCQRAERVMVCTTLPPGGPDESVTECFFFPGSKEFLMNLPGFAQSLVNPATPAFRLAPAPGKGKGLFSTHAQGGRPHSQRATAPHMRQHSFGELERHYALSVARMRPEAKAAFMALANSHTQGFSGPINGIVGTNGIGLDGLRPRLRGEDGMYHAICKDISRLNHSCSPNTFPRFDLPSFSYQLFAVRDIAAGEELTFEYRFIDCPAAERNQGFKPYGLVCECPACMDASASDARRAAITAFSPSIQAWAHDPTLADDWLLAKCRAQLALIAREGVESLAEHAHATKTAMYAHICLGDARGASKWAAKLDRFTWEEYEDVTALLDPLSAAYQAHPMWRLRRGANVPGTGRASSLS
ncbi:hypothetical protein DFH09DRAFT_1307375 [Mycena vulgaris]|nr:hypothetical protein DFH09DRAFT_1307375 [Mycena vulgaris]